MQPSGEPVLGCLEAQSKVELSDTPIQSEGVDPLPMEVTSHSFDDGVQPLVFSTEAAFPTHESSRGPFSPSLGAPSVASEGAPGATCQAGPTRAVLECFAGQAQLASALIKQGYFSYGVDRIKQKSAMAPVLQMDLSSRTACDLILTWLDQQKVAGVMICVPKHELEQLPKAFRQLAVPFGSTKAVYFFLRVARALWTILVKGALIPTTNYFDDFVLLALSGDRSSCSHAFDEVMNLLGWKLSEDKSTDWSTSFEALGVLFEIDQTGSGVLKVRNTEKRREELTSLIQGFLASGVMTQKEARQIRGRLQFAQAQFFGRLGRRCLNEITRRAYSGRLKLSTSAKERLEEFGKFLSSAQPRLVGQVSCRTFMILTDAAFEKESRAGGLGGVLLTGSGSALSYFSVPISDQQADALTAQEEQTIIYELEMFGVLVGLKLLVEKTTAFAEAYSQAGATAGTGVTCYIDNDAARHAFISGTAKKGVAGIIDEVNFLEYVHGILPWCARVASPANLADEPSRMKLDLVWKLGFKDESVEATKIVLSIVGRASTLAGDTATPFQWGIKESCVSQDC